MYPSPSFEASQYTVYLCPLSKTIRIGAEVSLHFNSWNAFSHRSFHSNFDLFPSKLNQSAPRLSARSNKTLVQQLLYLDLKCHTPIPGPTHLVDPNRVRGTRSYTGTLYLLYQTLVYPSLITITTYHIQKSKIKLPP